LSPAGEPAGLLIAAIVIAGCASIGLRDPPEVHDAIVNKSTQLQPQEGVHADVQQDGTVLKVHLVTSCASVETTTIDRTTTRPRYNASPGRDIAWGVLAAAMVGAGVALTVDAESVASDDKHSRTYNSYGPTPERATGIGLMAGGGAVAIIPIVDAFRSSGSTGSTARVTEKRKIVEEGLACPDAPKAHVRVIAAGNGSTRLPLGETDDVGNLRLDLATLPDVVSRTTDRPDTLDLSTISGDKFGAVSFLPMYAAHEEQAWKDLAVPSAACDAAERADACGDIAAYVAAYPKSARAGEAKQLLARAAPKLERAREEAAWATVSAAACARPKSEDGCDGVKSYLGAYPAGAHAEEARRALKRGEPIVAALVRRRQQAESTARLLQEQQERAAAFREQQEERARAAKRANLRGCYTSCLGGRDNLGIAMMCCEQCGGRAVGFSCE
jgi:hypothetical protein